MISPSAQLKKASAKIAPAVILVTTFDSSGKLLRTGTGFFAERDGRLIATLDLVQGAAYAVAKTSDGKIRNVTGVIASLPSAGLAVLRAETKTGVPFVSLSKTTESTSPVALVGSSLQHREQPLGALQITGHATGPEGTLLTTSAGISTETSGAPLVDENGEVIGVVTTMTQNNQPPRAVIRPSAAIASLLAQTRTDSSGRWLVAGSETPTPTPAPKGKLIYNPAPTYPERARNSRPPMFGSGRFRILFGTTGQVKEVQIVRSTGQAVLDQAAIEAFRQWKSTPGQEWSLVIPITFRP
jgi:TonB family protein